ncbi:MAG: nickel-dependent hydrogenase large subunit [Acidimicrobiia bacterium]|nr:nickel-dependent hydrogenase large subunit [Acidimicrobiia bacterium]
MSDGTREIRTDYLARVEGEGAMLVRIRDGALEEVQFKIFEPPRFFEALLRGRQFGEVPDITARICGICPIAYMASSAAAMEQACGVVLPDDLRALRRLIYCGEWIESHVLHVAMLHAPDFLGYDGAIELARDRRDLVEMALRLKKLGNALMTVVGGRDVHPVNFRVGGLYRAPTVAQLRAVVPELEWARDAARELVRWTAGFDFPDYEHDYAFVSLREPGEYPIERGRLVSSTGLDISIEEYEEHFTETHVERSNALHSTLEGVGSYLVGPLARYALNFDELSDVAKEAADEVGLGPVCRNPFRSIVVRAVEVLYAADEALRIIDEYERPQAPAVQCVPRAATGYGCTEAPRGICWHRYEIDADGVILDAKIVPPTSQNQKTIEDDLFGVVSRSLDLSDEQLSHLCEQTIRNYDPCISCATHFLHLEVERL